eukprot:m.116897 g.116897  ORF g.116897 m.116897 type:complete len:394 (+) comp10932_c0_seq4:117-1298(+)
MQLLRPMRGVLLVTFLVWSSITTAAFVLFPVLLLHPAAPKKVLAVLRGVCAAWFALGAVMMERLGGISVSVDVRGATPKQLEHDVKNLLVVMNHHCRLDWLFTWSIELRHGWAASKVVILKKGLRHIPGIGWAMQMLRYIFLHRSWTRDEERISCVLRSLQRDGPASVILFPEGTDLSKENKARAQHFAKERGLPLHENVLIPRSRGFVHIFNTMKGAADPLVVWDVTVGYVGLPQGSGEKDFLRGLWPRLVHYRISRWPVEQMPANESGLTAWLKDRWAEKELLLDDFNECEGAHMMLPAEANAPTSPLGDTTDKQMLLPTLSPSPFPWDEFIHSGAPALLIANLVMFPGLLVAFSSVRWWLCIASVILMICGKLGGLDTLIAGVPSRPKEG